MTNVDNPYLVVLERNLPRVLSLVSRDSLGNSLGVADRRFWAWKTVDFPNASMQSLAGGFARLSKRSNLSDSFRNVDYAVIAKELIHAIGPMTSRNGGLAEAFPGEDSFCVTGQVLSEAMDALIVLEESLTPDEIQNCLDLLSPLALFLLRHDETHGVISNHLATSALALVRWGIRTGDAKAIQRAQSFIGRVDRFASHEGWFLEYSGPDPGYQTWAMSSLTQIFEEAPGLVNPDLIASGMKFLAPFALANGSFANGAGARLTSFLMTIGPELMANSSAEAAFLAGFARKHVPHRRFVSLDAVDEPNIAPFFNDVVRSAELFDRTPTLHPPFSQAEVSDFTEGGLYVRHSGSRSLVVSALRGGWFCVAEEGKTTAVHSEPVFEDLRERLFVARAATEVEVRASSITLRAKIQRFRPNSQSPLKLLILRMFMFTLGKWRAPREYLKRLLSRYLLTRQEKPVGVSERTVDLRTGKAKDEVQSILELSQRELVGAPHHMASYGYWRY